MTEKKLFLEIPKLYGDDSLYEVAQDICDRGNARIAELERKNAASEGLHQSALALIRNPKLLTQAAPELAVYVAHIREEAERELEAARDEKDTLQRLTELQSVRLLQLVAECHRLAKTSGFKDYHAPVLDTAIDRVERALEGGGKVNEENRQLRARVAELEEAYRERDNMVTCADELYEECKRERDEALARAEQAEKKAASHERDWYEAKQQFGDAMGRARTQIRELEFHLKSAVENAVKVVANKAPTVAIEKGGE